MRRKFIIYANINYNIQHEFNYKLRLQVGKHIWFIGDPINSSKIKRYSVWLFSKEYVSKDTKRINPFKYYSYYMVRLFPTNQNLPHFYKHNTFDGITAKSTPYSIAQFIQATNNSGVCIKKTCHSFNFMERFGGVVI